MRIAVTGTANVGKTTFIRDFLKNWSGIYKTPEKSYRDVIVEKGLNHSSKTSIETQQAILDFMVDQHMKYTRDDCVIFDRCPIDNLVYSIHSYDKQNSNIDEKFIEDCIPMVKESMRFLDILFYIPYDESIAIEDDGMRDTDKNYIIEIDNILKQIEHQSLQPTSVFFHTDDRPAIIRISGNPKERIRQASLYITDQGDQYNEDDTNIDWEELANFGIEPKDVFPGGKL